MFEPLLDSLASPRLFYFWLFFSFILGLLWGSFFNVCIYRIPMGLSPNHPRRSFCYSCGTPLAWFDNIPLVSWLSLRGRCRSCGTSIRARYFLVELATGFLFAAIWAAHNSPALLEARGFSASVLWYWAVAGLLVVGAMTDLDHWIIPDGITKGGCIAALAAALVLPWIDAHSIIARGGPFPALLHTGGDPIEIVAAALGSPDREARREEQRATTALPRTPPRPGSAQNPVSQAEARRILAERRTGGAAPQLAGAPAAPAPAAPVPAPPPARNLLADKWPPFLNAAVGAFAGYGLLWAIAVIGRVVFRKEAMGAGDLKLFAFLGAVYGPFLAFVLLFMASIVGAALGMIAMGWSLIRPPRTVPVDEWAAAHPLPEPEPAATPLSAAETADTTPETAAPPAADTGPSFRTTIARAYLRRAALRPAARSLHHIPFGPSISIAALVLLLFHDPIQRTLLSYLLPVFGH